MHSHETIFSKITSAVGWLGYHSVHSGERFKRNLKDSQTYNRFIKKQVYNKCEY